MTDAPAKPFDVTAYRARVRALSGNWRKRAEQAFNQMFTAFRLANGPCEARSLVWADRLRTRRANLESLLTRAESAYKDAADPDEDGKPPKFEA